MRILIITPVCPYGHSGGHASRVRNLYEALQRDHEVWVLYAPFRAGLPNPKDTTVIGDRLLAYGGWRQFIRKWLSLSARVTRDHRSRPIRHKKIHPDKLCPLFLPGMVAQIVARYEIEAVLVEYVFLSKALCKLPASILKVIDTHDLFAERADKIPNNSLIPWPWCIANLREDEEIKALCRADTVLAIQAEEGSALEKAGCANVEVVPYLDARHVNNEYNQTQCENPFALAYFGSDWAPNIHGIEWFIREVLPRIRAVDGRIHLRLYGTVSKAIAPAPHVESIGFVDDIELELKRCSVTVIPVFTGTGMNLKLVEALGWGLPVVATNHAFRGLGETIKERMAATDDAKLFSESILRLLFHEDERLERGRVARACYNEICRHSEAAIRRTFQSVANKTI